MIDFCFKLTINSSFILKFLQILNQCDKMTLFCFYCVVTVRNEQEFI